MTSYKSIIISLSPSIFLSFILLWEIIPSPWRKYKKRYFFVFLSDSLINFILLEQILPFLFHGEFITHQKFSFPFRVLIWESFVFSNYFVRRKRITFLIMSTFLPLLCIQYKMIERRKRRNKWNSIFKNKIYIYLFLNCLELRVALVFGQLHNKTAMLLYAV